MTKTDLYGIVSNIKNYMGINNSDYPINTFDLCKKIDGIAVARTPFRTKDLRGMLRVAKDNSENSVILINSNKTLPEQNYHCAHEFMHLFADTPKAGTILKCYDKVKPNQDAYTEWVANEGAAELLAPYKLFIPYFSGLYDLYMSDYNMWRMLYGTGTVAQVLARQFGISEMVAIHRIENLSYEIDQYRSHDTIEGIVIRSKQSQNKMNIVSTNYLKVLNLEEAKHNFAIPWDGVIGAMGF